MPVCSSTFQGLVLCIACHLHIPAGDVHTGLWLCNEGQVQAQVTSRAEVLEKIVLTTCGFHRVCFCSVRNSQGHLEILDIGSWSVQTLSQCRKNEPSPPTLLPKQLVFFFLVNYCPQMNSKIAEKPTFPSRCCPDPVYLFAFIPHSAIVINH